MAPSKSVVELERRGNMLSTNYPGSYQIKAMKYGKAPDVVELLSRLKSGEYIAQPKMDGANYTLEKTLNGDVYLFGRTVSKKTGELTEKGANVPHIISWANSLPNGTILCGEIYKPGGTSKDVTKAMGALPEKAVALQETDYGKLHYYIFDMIMYNGVDMRDLGFETRYSDLCRFVDIKIDNPDYIEIAKTKTGYNMYDTIMQWIDAGGEGAVVKSKFGEYQPDKRPSYNFKVKQHVDSIDFVITEVLPPEREYRGKEPETWPYKDMDGTPVTKAFFKGWAGGIRVGAYDDNGNLVNIGRVTSGIDDRMLAYLVEEPAAYVGRTCEINCMSLDKERHTFRHPYFVQMRYDKPATDCVISEIFD